MVVLNQVSFLIPFIEIHEEAFSSPIAQISEFSNRSRTHDLPKIPVGAEHNDDCMFCTVEFPVLSKASRSQLKLAAYYY